MHSRTQLRSSHLVPKNTHVLTLFFFILLGGYGITHGQDSLSTESNATIFPVGNGWANNSVNAVVFRQNSVTSHQNYQYLAYYDAQGIIILAKRAFGEEQWKKHTTRFSGNVEDAHNSISIEVDGDGLLHIAWGMHGDSLQYAQSLKPGGLKLSARLPMADFKEDKITYPRFYRLENGDLLFMYRYGSSGSGNIRVNRYDIDSNSWKNVHDPLIDGQGERNAYMNTMAIDSDGGWHISWTWRETWDVSTNHDIMYAYSPDEGKTWLNTEGEELTLPITADIGKAYEIPQGSELINQTSMAVTEDNEPVIATYWKGKKDEAPQFYAVWKDDKQWQATQVGHRSLDFSLSGGGTKRIPISRPQIVAGMEGDLYMVYRDFERGGGITIAHSADNSYEKWEIFDVYNSSIGLWEPSYDSHSWLKKQELHLFGQRVGQGDGEQTEELGPQQVFLLKWIPPIYR